MATANRETFVIPARPDVVAQLSTVLMKPESDTDTLAMLIKRDVALYANILALINSPCFGAHRRVSSIEQAITLLGVKRLCHLVRAAGLRSDAGEHYHLEHFWEEACEVATICAHLTRYLPQLSGDDAFTLGMMHACGVPLMVRHCTGYQRLYEVETAIHLAEKQRMEQGQFHTNQFALSAHLARAWQVPQLLCQAIMMQPDAEALLDNDQNDPALCHALCLLLIGRDLSLRFETLWGRAEEYQPIVDLDAVLHYLGMTSGELDMIQQELFSGLLIDDSGIVPNTH